jgi:hypothetical protein
MLYPLKNGVTNDRGCHVRHDPGFTGCLLFPLRDIPGDPGHV